ncbi:PadR family transcriptional regulator [Microbacterium sp. No. 7]|uniref:PadR family transcriptional regulator n=1 Tax=Microbacterium sp. No. 7 TaxID=1714373 RepID=UPI0006CF2DB7|nr:PadR family transcriptional regulator [Microbacterium sp. No. 7]ALJ21039.1 PadR family transcriptional regulator [Microbacterium sp. No. 7]
MDEASERMATNIRKGVLEFCVLALLSGRDMYGLELAETLVERGLTASEGSLYPLLARMRESGAVETRWEPGDGTRARRYYAITSAGRAQLATFRAVWQTLSPRVAELLDDAHRDDPATSPASKEHR